MTEYAVALIGILGTLVGAAISGWFHSRSARTAVLLTNEYERRQSAISSIATFVEEVGVYRRSELTRAFNSLDGVTEKSESAARSHSSDVRSLRTRARTSALMLRVLPVDPKLSEAAYDIVRRASGLSDLDSTELVIEEATKVDEEIMQMLDLGREVLWDQ